MSNEMMHFADNKTPNLRQGHAGISRHGPIPVPKHANGDKDDETAAMPRTVVPLPSCSSTKLP